MCPKQFQLLLLLVILCCHLILSIHHRYWYRKLFSFFSSVFVIFHVSQPYSRTGRTEVLNSRILVPLPIPLAAHTFHSLWNAPCALCSLFLISLLPPPSLSTIALRYTNSLTSSTSSPVTTVFSLF